MSTFLVPAFSFSFASHQGRLSNLPPFPECSLFILCDRCDVLRRMAGESTAMWVARRGSAIASVVLRLFCCC